MCTISNIYNTEDIRIKIMNNLSEKKYNIHKHKPKPINI